jgi:predicted nucleotidyltransferase
MIFIENVSRLALALVPLFRSEQQLSLLGVLFTGSDKELTIGELAERAGVAEATASREVARLAQHGLVVTRALGRNNLVQADWSLPWARELRSILMQTIGVLGRLGAALCQVKGVDAAFVFGSWAAAYAGEPGPAPRDVDLLVIGEADPRVVRRASRDVESELHVEINPVVVDPVRWAAKRPEPFIAEIREGPLVPVALET